MTINDLIAAFLRRVHLTYLMNDETKIKLWYRLAFGKKLNLSNPQTYSEKLQWLKLYDRKPEYTMMVDKFAVKDYVKNKIDAAYVVPLLGVWDKPEQIEWDQLPNQFVLKTTYGCANSGVAVVKDGEIVKKDKKRQKAIITKLKKSTKRDTYKMLGEWPYKDVPKRIIAEQYLEDQYGELRDYKFFCFNGEVKALYVATGRNSGDVRFTYFDADFNRLPMNQGHPSADIYIEKPTSFDKMKQLAHQLSKGIPHVRVDFYDVNGKLYFGEFTFYNQAGYTPFKPNKWDKIFGDWIMLPKK